MFIESYVFIDEGVVIGAGTTVAKDVLPKTTVVSTKVLTVNKEGE